ncbi:MAG: PAS domain S-box protein [Acidimicrobiales bacterium]|jgi:PAS domain S-box-containing protein
MHALPDGIAMVDADGVIVFVNHRLQEISGYRADELSGRPVEYLVPDHLAGTHARHRALFHNDPDRRPMGTGLEVTLRRKNGSSLPVDVQLSAIDIGTGPYVLASVRDITQRKEIDEALRQSEERFRSFVEAAPVMMFSLLPDGVIRSVNREFERRTGWRRDDLIGTHFAPLVHPDDLSDALATLDKFVRNEEIDDHEVRIRTVSGDYLLTESTVVPLSSDDQGVEMVGVIHDITGQKQTEDQLSQTKERFRQAFKQAPLGVALTDRDGRITNANYALCDFLGYPREELLGTSFSSRMHPDDVASDAGLVRQLDDGTLPHYQIEQRYITKSGDVAYGTMTASVIFSDDGERLYGMRTVGDITEKVRFARELASHAALAKTRLATLTPREREVLELLDETVTASELAAQIFVSTRTVESHLAHAYRKLGVRTRAEARESFARMKSLVERHESDVRAAPPDVAT